MPKGEMKDLHFVFCIHNHQPIGNFGFVLEDAYQRAYRPFLETMAAHPSVKFVLHNSGCLLEWMEKAHPEYFDSLREMVGRGQVEILTGGFYEPILAMIPDRDKILQISRFSEYLEKHFGVSPRGMWLAERVWEPQLARWLREAGVEYTGLDDFHFRAVGLTADRLLSHFTTEEQGRAVQIFPLSEALRYHIPFRSVEDIEEYFRSLAEEDPGSLVVFGDDGEKLGIWPGTHKTVYGKGWLNSFLAMLERNSDWLHTGTFSEWLAGHESAGLVYLPTLTYPEMMEWALPADRWDEYRGNRAVLMDTFEYRWSPPFLKGGYWRNFLAKYPESYRMYRKMLDVREQLVQVDPQMSLPRLEPAWTNLWQGQCNCAYWHGVFGGLYLKHLRTEIYRRVISAEVELDRFVHGDDRWSGRRTVDFDGSGSPVVVLSNEDLNVFVSPRRGGSVFELDFKPSRTNLTATLARRPEGYHGDLARAAGAETGDGDSGNRSIHDRVAAKEEGLDAYLVFDRYAGESGRDHFVSPDVTPDEMRETRFRDLGDFADAPYDLREPDEESRAAVTLERNGLVKTHAGPRELRITKSLSLEEGGRLVWVYEIHAGAEGVDGVLFGTMLNLAMSAGDAEECYFLINGEKPESGLLGSQGDDRDVASVSLVDRYSSTRIDLSLDRAARLIRFPVITVSMSEGGFEKSYQSSVVVPLWDVRLQPDERMTARIEAAISVLQPAVEEIQDRG